MSVYHQEWTTSIGNVSLEMDPTTSTVHMNVSHTVDTSISPHNPVWAYAFQDVADFAYYGGGNPFDHVMDYVVSFGSPSSTYSFAKCVLVNQNEVYVR